MEDVDAAVLQLESEPDAVFEYPVSSRRKQRTWRVRLMGLSQVVLGLALVALGMTLAFIGVRTQKDETVVEQLAYNLPVFVIIYFGVSLVIGSAAKLRLRHEQD